MNGSELSMLSIGLCMLGCVISVLILSAIVVLSTCVLSSKISRELDEN